MPHPVRPRPRPEIRSVLVVGAGLAATALVAALRSGGFRGMITVVGDEEPYDRPPLSKELFTRAAPADLRDQFALVPDAATWVRARATSVSGTSVRLRAADGGTATAAADAVVLAVGAAPFVPTGWGGVRTLSRWDEAVEVRAALTPGAHLVVAGAGWIGLELASSAVAAGVRVTVVEDTGRPLGRLLPAAVGDRMSTWLDGVTLVAGRAAAGSATRLRLDDGRVVRGDVVVAALGARPATGWLPPRWLDPTGHVRTTTAGEVAGAPGTWAIGDCAAGTGGQHWNAAVAAAERCARALLGRTPSDAPAPSVFSTMFGHQVDLVGLASPGLEVLWREGEGWTALLLDGEELAGGVAADRPRDVAALRRLLAGGRVVLDPTAAADPGRRLTEAVRRR